MTKVIKSKEDATTGIEVTDNSVTIVVGTASHPNGIRIDESGVYVAGKLSFMAKQDEQRTGGLWVKQDPWKDMFPSTAASPVPHLIISPPLSGLADMASGVALALSFLV